MLRGAALADHLAQIPLRDRDASIDRLLGLGPAADMPDLPRGAVPYLPCGVDEILAMVRDVPLGAGDHLVDLGSGLGRVVMLGHLLSNARATGIEIQGHLVERARKRCAALGLTSVAFHHANAADLDLDGSVFFLYAPCNGEMLARVLDRVGAVARRRPIVVCTVGLELADAAWLTPRASSHVALNIYDSRT